MDDSGLFEPLGGLDNSRFIAASFMATAMTIFPMLFAYFRFLAPETIDINNNINEPVELVEERCILIKLRPTADFADSEDNEENEETTCVMRQAKINAGEDLGMFHKLLKRLEEKGKREPVWALILKKFLYVAWVSLANLHFEAVEQIFGGHHPLRQM